MVLGGIDLNEIPVNDGGSTTSEGDESSIDGGSTTSECDGFELDELKFNDGGINSGVGNGGNEKWFVGSTMGDCPLEKLLEEENAIDICADDVLGIEFTTIEAAEIFYRKYSLFVGFRVRRDDKKKNGCGVVVSRRWVCNRAGAKVVRKDDDGGAKKRKEQAVTRVWCRATMKVKLDKTNWTYVVCRFSHVHNHELVCLYQLQFLRSNRKVKEGALATAVALRRVCVSTRQIMEMFVSQCGGYEYVGFTKKDLQNALNEFGYGEVETSDAETMLVYFRAKGQADKDLFVRYSVDENNTLENLFWSDSVSRYDYACFDDVVGFDGTYNKNKYRKPVVMMIGTNSHWRTTVYGVGILANETFESYLWLLEMFLDAMYHKAPVTVITDGDKAMRAAVKAVFPNCHHRLCAWHLCRNARKHVCNRKFLSELGAFMYGDLSVVEFENRWKVLVNSLNLQGNRWVRRIYKMRCMWGATFLKGTFFAGMRTTQRSESLNGVLKEHFNRKCKLHEVVEEMDKVLGRIRNNELGDDYKSRHTGVTLSTRLQVYERHALRLYMRPIFLMVRDEIVEEHDLVAERTTTNREIDLYTIRQFMGQRKEWLVHYRHYDKHMYCSCKLFESEGLPCAHAFAVLRVRHEKFIPDSLISPRWMLDAKPDCDFGLGSLSFMTEQVQHVSRFGSLSIIANRACYVASRDSRKYEQMMEYLNSFCADDIEKGDTSQKNRVAQNADSRKGTNKVVGDSDPVRSKGAPRQARGTTRRQYKCGRCQGYGHNSRNCVKNTRRTSNGEQDGRRNGSNNDGGYEDAIDNVWDEVDAVCPSVGAVSGDTCELSI